METYIPSQSITFQFGKGHTMDRYIYQEGEGIGSFLGNMFQTIFPFLKQGIKGIAAVAKPHLKATAADIVRTGTKRVLEKLDTPRNNPRNTPRKNKKRRRL